MRSWPDRAQDIRAYVEAATHVLEGEPRSEEVERRRSELALLLKHAQQLDPLAPEAPA